MAEESESPTAAVLRLLTGYRVSQAVYVLVKLGIPDRLASGPQDAAGLAQQAGVHPDRLVRVLRALASVGVLTMDGDRFGLTPLGELLRTDVRGSVAPFAVFQGEESYRSFGELLHTVRTGETAFDHVYGKGHFEYLATHPEASATFNAAMVASAQLAGNPVLGYDFRDRTTVIDVGGGRGALIASVLRAHPHLRGVLYDLPAAVAEAPAYLASQGVADRCEIRTGNALESVPSGGDVYVMSRILHDWPDDSAAVFLLNCRKAMGRQGVLLLVEGVLPDRAIPARRALLDLQMMALNGGRERTEKEWWALLRENGFSLAQVWPGKGNQDLIEARPL